MGLANAGAYFCLGMVNHRLSPAMHKKEYMQGLANAST
jgi:hypothetical protein